MSKILNPSIYVDEDVTNIKSARFMAESAEKHRVELKAELLSLILSTPKDITPKDEEPILYLKERFNYLWEELWDAFIDDYKYTAVADDAEYCEPSLVKKRWKQEIKELKKLQKEAEERKTFFETHKDVLSKTNFDDIMLYERFKNKEIDIPNIFTKEDRENLLKEIKEKEQKLLEEAIKNGK